MRKFLVGIAVVLAALYLWNASWLAPAPTGQPRLIAHRGVHQSVNAEATGAGRCGAARIDPPRHAFLENTLASMEAAFVAGADIVALDVHPTSDGQFAVFRDATLDCLTESSGPVRERPMTYLKRLDIGHRYTPDRGRNFPFRGDARGQMPSLAEVLVAMPQRRFLVNFWSDDRSEGDQLAGLVARNRQWRGTVWGVTGGEAPATRAVELLPDTKSLSRAGTDDCLTRYMALGWLDYTPEACRRTVILVPSNIASRLWGWPNRFLVRMRDAGTDVILVGPYEDDDDSIRGIDDTAALDAVPAGFGGYIWTDRIEEIGPALGRGRFDDGDQVEGG